MDVPTAVVTLGGVATQAKLLDKLLGPTAEYLGDGLRDWTKRRGENLGRVFQNAAEKLGSRIDAPGAVPPKVLKGILTEGEFCEDAVAADYFGGVLASSRTAVDRDDRGATYTALLGRLSTYQIRSHFFFYSTVRALYAGQPLHFGGIDGRARARTFVPFEAYERAMQFAETEHAQAILDHVMFGLVRDALIETFAYGSAEHLAIPPGVEVEEAGGITFGPSVLGVELYLWGHGRGDLAVESFLDPDVELPSTVPLLMAPEAKCIAPPAQSAG